MHSSRLHCACEKYVSRSIAMHLLARPAVGTLGCYRQLRHLETGLSHSGAHELAAFVILGVPQPIQNHCLQREHQCLSNTAQIASQSAPKTQHSVHTYLTPSRPHPVPSHPIPTPSHQKEAPKKWEANGRADLALRNGERGFDPAVLQAELEQHVKQPPHLTGLDLWNQHRVLENEGTGLVD